MILQVVPNGKKYGKKSKEPEFMTGQPIPPPLMYPPPKRNKALLIKGLLTIGFP